MPQIKHNFYLVVGPKRKSRSDTKISAVGDMLFDLVEFSGELQIVKVEYQLSGKHPNTVVSRK